MIATTINFRTTNGDQLKTIVAYNKVDGMNRVLGERECEVLQFGPALSDEVSNDTIGAATHDCMTTPGGTEECKVRTSALHL
jgi:hypothetical protein